MAMRLLTLAAVVVGCASAQSAAVPVSPVFARYGVRAETGGTAEGEAEIAARPGPDAMRILGDVRSHIGMITNDGPHVITSVLWIWTGITPDGRRIPMVMSPGGIWPGQFSIAARTFLLNQGAYGPVERAKRRSQRVAGRC